MSRRKRKSAKAKAMTAEQLEQVQLVAKAREAGIPEHRIASGHLGMSKVVDLDGSLGGKRNSIVPVIINRGGTAVERWINNDRQGLFGESEQRAIRYCQNLWERAEGNMRAVDPSADFVDGPLGWAQQEAMVELKKIEERVPRPYWSCFENVVRFDEEAGTAGSSLANNNRSAIDAAKTTVAFTASLVAMWRRL